MPLDRPCGGLPSQPTSKRSSAQHGPALSAVSAHPVKTGEEIQSVGRRWSAGKQPGSAPGRWWLRFEAKGGGRLTVGSSPRRRARAGKSHRWQTGEGVEAGVEVDVEVPGTRAVLGVEQV
jgi:hypothetical protein